ncbi:hypothetical protein PVAND_012678 [Polypedilum vanderplanki]|uniref:Uncharacterized protein n=1 Tax=Polypedilum vanderplanki TaxID=319348 RepID=A0A9J6CMC7_POLVA|nr:hypothetical protein PVAND_012678 [Polypedilum vanderplanki]
MKLSTENKISGIGRKIPKAVPFILLNILLERYSTTGISSVLLLFLHNKLSFDQGTSTALFHTNEFLSYFFPILGAILGDSYWGLYKTLTIMSLVFAAGSGIISISGIELLHLPVIYLTIFGLIISVIGSGSVRANLTAFGGSQYQVPEQNESLKLYFSIQLVFLKMGSLLGRAINPILKENSCFDSHDCYPLAFGIPSLAMLTALLLLICGKSFYIHKAPTDNIFLKVCGCVKCGLKEFFTRNKKIEKKNHWLDYAIIKYDQKLIDDTKQVLRILIIFSPMPIYWAVYMQQSSKWIFQATRTNGNIGWFTIKPDQMIALNPLFSILLMAFCNYVLFPLLAKIKIHTLLHKIAIGIILCCVAFGIAIFTEIMIQKSFISILWLFPQFAVLALAENCAFASMLNFAFTEGPTSMKSVMTACVFVTIAFGNLIVTIVSASKLFSSQIIEYLFFIGVLLVALFVFLFFISKFKNNREEK